MRHAWHLFVVRTDEAVLGFGRDELMSKLKDRGIGTGVHFRAVHTHKYYRSLGVAYDHLPNTDWNSERICSLPLFPDMKLDDVDRVVAEIVAVAGDA